MPGSFEPGGGYCAEYDDPLVAVVEQEPGHAVAYTPAAPWEIYKPRPPKPPYVKPPRIRGRVEVIGSDGTVLALGRVINPPIIKGRVSVGVASGSTGVSGRVRWRLRGICQVVAEGPRVMAHGRVTIWSRRRYEAHDREVVELLLLDDD